MTSTIDTNNPAPPELAIPDATRADMQRTAIAVKETPGHGVSGRHAQPEGLDRRGRRDPGLFGRMFPRLRPLVVDDDRLAALARVMVDEDGASPAGDNPDVPAGFTYLGQFVDHDISLDLASLSDKEKDPLAIENFRSPGLDLDSLYGLGPDGSPHLYTRGPAGSHKHGPKLLRGKNITVGFGNVVGAFDDDLPRSPEGMAIIGDHRNDENLLVAQTHLAFIKFHNKICDLLTAQPTPPDDIFAEARKLVIWHYQWLVLHDFIARVVEPGVVEQVLTEGRRYYHFRKSPFMPVEFSAAAYRLGHSMVREGYDHNRVFPRAGFNLLFAFSGLSGQILGIAADPPGTPTPVPVLPSNWIIDWRRFYDLGPSGGSAAFGLNNSRLLDPFLAKSLSVLPGADPATPQASLAFRNLKRGVKLGLPSGQSVAKAMHIENPLTPAEIATGRDGAVASEQKLHKATPLWYYILKEAQIRQNGRRLGPVGSRIVAEVFVGLLQGDPKSFLSEKWTPTLPSEKPGEFRMTDLLRFVDEINPIGDAP